MFKVFKYNINKDSVIHLPKGAKILSCIVQRGNICIYALVKEEETETYPVRIIVVGTGYECFSEFDFPPTFIGTVTFAESSFVFHVFYRTEDLR